MDKLLDKEVHPAYKAPSLVNYLTPRHTSNSTPPTSVPSSSGGDSRDQSGRGTSHPSMQSGTRASELDEFPPTDDFSDQRPGPSSGAGSASGAAGSGARPKTTYTLTYGQRYLQTCIVNSFERD